MAKFWQSVRAPVGGLVAGVGLLLAAAPVTAQTQAISARLALATFDSAWNRINTTHYDTTFAGVDWGAVRTELRPEAEHAATLEALRGVIREMLSRLGESHYSLIPVDLVEVVDPGVHDAGGSREGGIGLEMTLVDGRLAVWRVDSAGAAAAAGVRAGWFVESIGDFEPASAIQRLEELATPAERRNGLTHLLFGARGQTEGPVGSTVEIEFIDGGGDRVALTIRRRVRPGLVVRFGSLPPLVSNLEHWRIEGADGCIGVIRFNVWMAPLAQKIDRAVDDVRDCRGVVLDIRGNPGGVAGMVMGVAGHFLTSPVALGTMRRRGAELSFLANPRRVDSKSRPVEPFMGPLAILIDEMSVSTSEIFAGGMQAIGRARIFGETSAGQALPAGTYKLPDGDVLMHVLADFTDANGTRIEGRGVVPDVTVDPDREQLLEGRDPILDAAVDWIRSGHEGHAGNSRSADGTGDRRSDAPTADNTGFAGERVAAHESREAGR